MKLFNKLSTFTAVAALSVVFAACGGDDGPDAPPAPSGSLTAPQVSQVTHESAVLSTTLNGSATKVGFCYSTTSNPDISAANVTATSAADGSYSASITGLDASTVYYVRSFAVEGQSYIYSSQSTFTTASAPSVTPAEVEQYRGPQYKDHYVDLAAWSDRSRWNLANVHDPSVVLADDGYYYMYQTDASYGNAHDGHGHFHGRRSRNLVDWEYLGATMPALPDWVVPRLNELRKSMGVPEINPDVNKFGYWAPCVCKVRSGLYRMYYSIVCPGTINGDGTWSERAFIGMMENSDPANNDGWVDKGCVVTNASDRGLDFNVRADDWANCYFLWNAIDPTYIITESGEHWLIYGSWHSGIAAMRLDAATGMPAETLGTPWAADAAGVAPYGRLVATRQSGNRWQASEGPEIVYRNGYYYLFLAYDALDVPYNTRVVRSKSITGPYVGIDGTDVTKFGGDAYPIVTHPYKFGSDPGWVGLSHCAVFDDGNDNWYFASQGRLPANAYGNAYANANMLGHVRAMRWTSDGWPVVMPERYGAVPDLPVTEAELVGNWLNIDLGYEYGRMKESATLVLTADHKVSYGIWRGKQWSFDAASQVLTIDGVELYVARECDWESSPRVATIVYAGISGRTTYWGKKTR